MHVDLPSLCPIQPLELGREEPRCRRRIVVLAVVVGKVVADRLLNQFLFEEVHLIEEEDDRRLFEPWKV